MTPDRTNKWDASAYNAGHSFVYEKATDLVELLELDPTDRVLDLGCGTGELTRRAAETGATVVGIDPAREMIIEGCETTTTVDFVQGDARTLPFVRSFDAVLSNAVLHWVDDRDQDTVLSEIRRVLKPGGRFVAEFGGTGNVSRIVRGVQAALFNNGYEVENPWYFPTVSEYATRLERHGFEVRAIELFDRPTRLENGEDGLRNWLALFGDGFFAGLSHAERKSVIDDAEHRLREECFDGSSWVADYRRLRLSAVASGGFQTHR